MSKQDEAQREGANKKWDAAPDQVQTRKASDIQIRPVNWLWQDFLAQGSLHIVAGRPATGKTTLAIDFAAVVSSGGYWPDSSVGNRPAAQPHNGLLATMKADGDVAQTARARDS